MFEMALNASLCPCNARSKPAHDVSAAFSATSSTKVEILKTIQVQRILRLVQQSKRGTGAIAVLLTQVAIEKNEKATVARAASSGIPLTS